MRAVVVQKFGGACLKDEEQLKGVASYIEAHRVATESSVVVVSAMGDTTDRLLERAARTSPHPSPRELDLLLATGEQESAALLTMALVELGIPARSFRGDQVPIRTTRDFGAARIEFVAPQAVQASLDRGEVAVVAGFQGVTSEHEITTLGRGGSDLTAVAMAAALEASRCEFYKDVPGIMTADPEICAEARVIARMTYDELLELASLGASVLQARSVQLAKRYRVPLRVRSMEESGAGTWVREEERNMESSVVAAVTCERMEGKVSVRGLDRPTDSMPELFLLLAKEGIVVDVIVQDQGADGRINLTFTVPRENVRAAAENAEKIAQAHGKAKVMTHEKVAKVSIVGLGMKSHSGVAADMFRILSREKIEVMAVSTSEIKISCVIEDRYAELAVRALHEGFGLAKEPH